MPRLEKYVHGSDLAGLKVGIYRGETIIVYYGFDNYNRSAEHCLTIIDAITKEFPEIAMREIEFYEITRSQSNRHANQTKACVRVPVEHALKHLGEYFIL